MVGRKLGTLVEDNRPLIEGKRIGVGNVYSWNSIINIFKFAIHCDSMKNVYCGKNLTPVKYLFWKKVWHYLIKTLGSK